MTAVEANLQSSIANPQSDSKVVVSVRGLTKVFKDFWNRPKARAVDNVDFDVRRGTRNWGSKPRLAWLCTCDNVIP